MREAYDRCHLNKFVERLFSVSDSLDLVRLIEAIVLNLRLSGKHLYSVVGHHGVSETV